TSTITIKMTSTELERMGGWEEENEEPAEDPPPKTCWDKFHTTISNWMLPADLRDKYLERTNCLPPPIFIIAISIAENFKDMVPLFGIFRILVIVVIVGTDVGFALFRRYISKVAGPRVSWSSCNL
ncbi:hypothetical protein AB205_0084970, partial [Aquarana catesbeiana]